MLYGPLVHVENHCRKAPIWPLIILQAMVAWNMMINYTLFKRSAYEVPIIINCHEDVRSKMSHRDHILAYPKPQVTGLWPFRGPMNLYHNVNKFGLP